MEVATESVRNGSEVHELLGASTLPMTFSDFVVLARKLAIRAFAADFQREHADGRERAQMLNADRPLADELSQDYAAWRRAALWVAAALLSLGVVVALVDYSSTAYQVASSSGQPDRVHEQVAQVELQFGSSNLLLLDGLQVFLLLVKIAVAVLVVFAALRWTHIGKSRTFARWAWLAALLVPLLISAWPWGQYLDFSHLDNVGWGNTGQAGAMAKQQVSVAIGAMLMVTVAPKLLALFPGIMRSSLALKTLLPQAAAPGWLTVVFAPFLAGFLLLVLCFMSQVQGSTVLIVGVLCLVVGPCIYVRNARDLVRPHTDDELREVVGGVRKQAFRFHLVGCVLLLLYVVGLEWLPWLTATHLLLEAGGGLLLTMVAISDITLALLAYSHRQGAEFHESNLRHVYESRLDALAGAGLTDLDASMRLPSKEEAFVAPTLLHQGPMLASPVGQAATKADPAMIETMISSKPPGPSIG